MLENITAILELSSIIEIITRDIRGEKSGKSLQEWEKCSQ